jgi:hypothetical protein
MAISTKEMYHGAVLYQIVGNPDFSLKLIERDKDEHDSGMYEVTTNTKDYVLYIKYSARPQFRFGGDSFCYFNFASTHINSLHRYPDKEFMVFLVCHTNHVCVLTRQDLDRLGLLQSNEDCGVTVSWQSGSELTVKSKYTTLPYKIPRNRLKNFDW